QQIVHERRIASPRAARQEALALRPIPVGEQHQPLRELRSGALPSPLDERLADVPRRTEQCRDDTNRGIERDQHEDEPRDRHLDEIAAIVDQHVAALLDEPMRSESADHERDDEPEPETHHSAPAARRTASERPISGRGGATSIFASSATSAAAARTPGSAASKSRSRRSAAAARLAAYTACRASSAAVRASASSAASSRRATARRPASRARVSASSRRSTLTRLPSARFALATSRPSPGSTSSTGGAPSFGAPAERKGSSSTRAAMPARSKTMRSISGRSTLSSASRSAAICRRTGASVGSARPRRLSSASSSAVFALSHRPPSSSSAFATER